MTVPVWMLLGFAAWTVILLSATVGVYRWCRILTGRVQIRDFRADQVEGEDWYRRAMRAHANCVENLPVFGAIVLALYAGKRDRHLCECVGSHSSDCPYSAIAGARMFRSDQHGGIHTLRVLFRAGRGLFVLDCDPVDQAEWMRMTRFQRTGMDRVPAL